LVFYGHFGIFFRILVYCTRKNLAALSKSEERSINWS
jgi:hypothetical protein